MKDGLPDGLWCKWYENGNLMEKSNLINGKLNGESIEYKNDGTIKIKKSYLNGIDK